MKLWKSFAIASILAGLGLPSIVPAQEKKITREELPAAVEKTVSEQSAGGTIRGFSTEIDGGKTVYEVEITINGHSKDISIGKTGNIIEVEEEVVLDSLSATVKEGLRRAAGTGVIGKVESLTKNGKLVAFEAVVKNGTKHQEIQVGPDGQKLAHPE